MYRRPSPGQLSFVDFYLPFGGRLSATNRWVKLATMIPWAEFEASYAEQFSEGEGAPAKTFRMALGALIIKEKLGLSDRETVQQVQENPYLQYFLGFHEYLEAVPFDSSLMTHFRKRLSPRLMAEVNQQVVAAVLLEDDSDASAKDEEPPSPGDEGNPPTKEALSAAGDSVEAVEAAILHQGRLLLDASVTPADIRYPTDLDLLNQARASSERILDRLYQTMTAPPPQKPRTYRQKARRSYLGWLSNDALRPKSDARRWGSSCATCDAI